MILKEASNTFVAQYKKTDRLFNSPVRSKFLSQNYLDNYVLIESICKNLNITH